MLPIVAYVDGLEMENLNQKAPSLQGGCDSWTVLFRICDGHSIAANAIAIAISIAITAGLVHVA